MIEPNGQQTFYRNWYQDFDPKTITQELMENGFEVAELWSDLKGTPGGRTRSGFPLSQRSRQGGLTCKRSEDGSFERRNYLRVG